MLPPFDEDGFLPAGIHECSLREAQVRFASFQESDRRPNLWMTFVAFLEQVKAAGVVLAVLLDGSFVTEKSDPNDIDLILIVSSTHDFRRELSPIEYNVLFAQRAKRLYKLDILVAKENSDQFRRYVHLFQQVRLEPGRTKGIVRLSL